jgi:hypothetical protein
MSNVGDAHRSGATGGPASANRTAASSVRAFTTSLSPSLNLSVDGLSSGVKSATPLPPPSPLVNTPSHSMVLPVAVSAPHPAPAPAVKPTPPHSSAFTPLSITTTPPPPPSQLLAPPPIGTTKPQPSPTLAAAKTFLTDLTLSSTQSDSELLRVTQEREEQARQKLLRDKQAALNRLTAKEEKEVSPQPFFFFFFDVRMS